MSSYLTKHMLDPLSYRNVADNEFVREDEGFFRRWLSAAAQRWRRRRTVRALENLDDRMLADIGVDRNNIRHVAAALDRRRSRITVAKAANKSAQTVKAMKAAAFGSKEAA